MLITFNYKKWTPPKLSREEESRIGAQICAHGRQHWLDEFDAKSKEGGFSQEPVWVILIILAAVIFVIVLLPPIIVLVPIWFAVYLGSAAFARYRFSRWLDRCVAAWQATSPSTPINSYTPTAPPKPVEVPYQQPAPLTKPSHVSTAELLARLAQGSFAERLSAIEHLERSSDPAAFAALRTALGDSDASVREAALRSLERRIHAK